MAVERDEVREGAAPLAGAEQVDWSAFVGGGVVSIAGLDRDSRNMSMPLQFPRLELIDSFSDDSRIAKSEKANVLPRADVPQPQAKPEVTTAQRIALVLREPNSPEALKAADVLIHAYRESEKDRKEILEAIKNSPKLHGIVWDAMIKAACDGQDDPDALRRRGFNDSNLRWLPQLSSLLKRDAQCEYLYTPVANDIIEDFAAYAKIDRASALQLLALIAAKTLPEDPEKARAGEKPLPQRAAEKLQAQADRAPGESGEDWLRRKNEVIRTSTGIFSLLPAEAASPERSYLLASMLNVAFHRFNANAIAPIGTSDCEKAERATRSGLFRLADQCHGSPVLGKDSFQAAWMTMFARLAVADSRQWTGACAEKAFAGQFWTPQGREQALETLRIMDLRLGDKHGSVQSCMTKVVPNVYESKIHDHLWLQTDGKAKSSKELEQVAVRHFAGRMQSVQELFDIKPTSSLLLRMIDLYDARAVVQRQRNEPILSTELRAMVPGRTLSVQKSIFDVLPKLDEVLSSSNCSKITRADVALLSKVALGPNESMTAQERQAWREWGDGVFARLLAGSSSTEVKQDVLAFFKTHGWTAKNSDSIWPAICKEMGCASVEKSLSPQAQPSVGMMSEQLRGTVLALLPKLNERQTNRSKGDGGKTDIEVVRTLTALSLSCDPKLTKELAREFKGFTESTLISVLKSSSDPSAQKQIFNFFNTFGWSADSDGQVSAGLKAFAKEHLRRNPGDYDFAYDASKLLDLEQKLPLPVVLRHLGVEPTPEVQNLLAKAIEKHGEKAVELALANMVRWNALSHTMREVVAGPASGDSRWLDGEFDDSVKKLATLSSLSKAPDCLEKLARFESNGKEDQSPISAVTILEMLSGVKPVTTKLDHLMMSSELKDVIEIATGSLRRTAEKIDLVCKTLEKNNQQAWKVLKEEAAKGNGFLFHRRDDLESGQSKAFSTLRCSRLLEAYPVLHARVVGELRQAELSQRNQEYFSAVMAGKRFAADKQAAEILTEFGVKQISMYAPNVCADFLPGKKANDGASEWQRAFTLLREAPNASSPLQRHLAMKEALEHLTSKSEVQDTFRLSAKVVQNLHDFQRLFQIGSSGSRGDRFPREIRDMAAAMEKSFVDLSRIDVLGLVRELGREKANLPVHSEEYWAVRQLQNSLESAYKLQRMWETRGNKPLGEMVKRIHSSDFDADDFCHWMKHTGAAIALETGITVGLLVFTGGAGNVARAGLSVGARVAMATRSAVHLGVCMTASDALSKEFYGRQVLGKSDGHPLFDALRGSKWQLKDGEVVAGPTLGEGLLRTAEQISSSSALNLCLMGFGGLVKNVSMRVSGSAEGMKQLTRLETALGKLPTEMQSSVATMMRQFEQQYCQMMKTVAQQHATEAVLLQAGLNHNTAGLLAAFVIAGGHGYKHSLALKGNLESLKLQHTVENSVFAQELRKQGFTVVEENSRHFLKLGEFKIELVSTANKAPTSNPKGDATSTKDPTPVHDVNPKTWTEDIRQLAGQRQLTFSGDKITYSGNRDTLLAALEQGGYELKRGVGKVFVVIGKQEVELVADPKAEVRIIRLSDSKGHDVNMMPVKLEEGASVSIGRDPANALVSPAHSVSRSHGRLGVDSKGTYFENLSTQEGDPSFGTWVRRGNNPKFESLSKGQKIYLDEVTELWVGGQPGSGTARRLRIDMAKGVDEVLAWPKESGPWSKLFQHGELSQLSRCRTVRGAALYEGTLTLPNGKTMEVYFHETHDERSAMRMKKELVSQKLHAELGFETEFPQTSPRLAVIGGEVKQGWIQAKAGEPLQWIMTASLREKFPNPTRENLRSAIDSDPNLKLQLEQAFVERMIFGDGDAHALNFVTKAGANGKAKIANIDLEWAFPDHPNDVRPEWCWSSHGGLGINGSIFKIMADKPLSEQTISRLRSFLEKYDTPAGKESLRQSGLTPNQTTGVIERVRWFVENGRLPRFEQGGESSSQKSPEVVKKNSVATAPAEKPIIIEEPKKSDVPKAAKDPELLKDLERLEVDKQRGAQEYKKTLETCYGPVHEHANTNGPRAIENLKDARAAIADLANLSDFGQLKTNLEELAQKHPSLKETIDQVLKTLDAKKPEYKLVAGKGSVKGLLTAAESQIRDWTTLMEHTGKTAELDSFIKAGRAVLKDSKFYGKDYFDKMSQQLKSWNDATAPEVWDGLFRTVEATRLDDDAAVKLLYKQIINWQNSDKTKRGPARAFEELDGKYKRAEEFVKKYGGDDKTRAHIENGKYKVTKLKEVWEENKRYRATISKERWRSDSEGGVYKSIEEALEARPELEKFFDHAKDHPKESYLVKVVDIGKSPDSLTIVLTLDPSHQWGGGAKGYMQLLDGAGQPVVAAKTDAKGFHLLWVNDGGELKLQEIKWSTGEDRVYLYAAGLKPGSALGERAKWAVGDPASVDQLAAIHKALKDRNLSFADLQTFLSKAVVKISKP